MNRMYIIFGLLGLIFSLVAYDVSAAHSNYVIDTGGNSGGGGGSSAGTGTGTSGGGGGQGGKNYLVVNNLDVLQKFRLGLVRVNPYNIVPVIDTIGERLETKFRVNFDAVFKEDVYVSGNLIVESLKGESGSGNAYVCVSEDGVLFRSNEPCR